MNISFKITVKWKCIHLSDTMLNLFSRSCRRIFHGLLVRNMQICVACVSTQRSPQNADHGDCRLQTVETMQTVQTVQTEYFFSNSSLTFFASNDKIVFNICPNVYTSLSANTIMAILTNHVHHRLTNTIFLTLKMTF